MGHHRDLDAALNTDLLVLDADPLTDIRNTTSIRWVMKGGKLYDGDTLEMEWPEARPLPGFKYTNFGPPPRTEWVR